MLGYAELDFGPALKSGYIRSCTTLDVSNERAESRRMPTE